MKNLLMCLGLTLIFGMTAFANEDTEMGPAGKAKALRNRPAFGCVVFEDIMNHKTRSSGKGTFDSNGQVSFQFQGNKKWEISAELTGWGAFGAAFNLKVTRSKTRIFNGTGIGYVEFTQYIDQNGKISLGDFSQAQNNSVDGVLNQVFCTPMKALSDIQ